MGFTYTGKVPDVLDDGRPLAPGDQIESDKLDRSTPHNASLIERGLLREDKSKGAPPKTIGSGGKKGDDD
jgi:hypothetical protein